MPRRLTYTPKIGAEICTMIAEGVGLKAACEKLGLNRNTVRGWIDDRVDFRLAYDQARRHRADHFQDEILEISDSVSGCEDPAAVNAARLQVDSRKWLASKLLPERFGDRQVTELVGAGGKDLLQPEEPKNWKISLILLNTILGVIEGRKAEEGEASPSALPAPPLSASSLIPALPELVASAPAEPETPAQLRERLRWHRVTGNLKVIN